MHGNLSRLEHAPVCSLAENFLRKRTHSSVIKKNWDELRSHQWTEIKAKQLLLRSLPIQDDVLHRSNKPYNNTMKLCNNSSTRNFYLVYQQGWNPGLTYSSQKGMWNSKSVGAPGTCAGKPLLWFIHPRSLQTKYYSVMTNLRISAASL